jgi:hypothetical protein
MPYLANVVRAPGDPKILSSGPSSISGTDRLGWALGWFSLGLGVLELVAPSRITRMLGIAGQEGVIQAYGAREIGAGMLTLSTERTVGLWARVAGDGLDVATLAAALSPRNPKSRNVRWAIAIVVGVTLLDAISVHAQVLRHARTEGGAQTYKDRSGFPQGVKKARGVARKTS